MKNLVLGAGLSFWIAMAAIWIFAAWAPPVTQPATADAAKAEYTAAEVAAHGDAASCWLIINGQVYDVTAYIDEHPANPRTILDYCGKEATRGFDTKDRDRPHSDAAARLLDRLRIGALSGD
ncbi:cytochrome b5 domain-containing protein [Dongia sp.]|uniref:cytochrome b5 domain-containing protein n=1 Tax=Dongia sp. TaxID=1977262 RepID=UPI003751BE39